MKLTDNTMSVLKNYASINENIFIRAGDTVKTMAVAKNVLSNAKLDQEFPKDFGIYDLPEFLSVLGLVESPELKFGDDSVTISDSSGLSSFEYFYSPEDMLTTPKKDLAMPSVEVSFALDTNTLSKVRRAASALGHDKMTITPHDGLIRLSVLDPSTTTSNTFVIDVPGECEEGVDFAFVISIENIKVIEDSYTVEISSKLISQFKNSDGSVVYYIALHPSSTYGA